MVLHSADRGATWRPPPAPALPSGSIRSLVAVAHSPTHLYLATDQGVWRLDPAGRRWEALQTGLASPRVETLLATSSALLAGTAAGVYELPTALAEEPPPARELLADFAHEPAIRDVHAAAIRHADVDQSMIRRWRRRAAFKALLPSFSLDLNRDRDTYLNGIGSTTNPDFDRVLTTDDPSRSLDIGLNWDLGDLIWNDDQTSIDTRSRLLVQLRDDILNDVTRTYFERRRLQLEQLTAPPGAPKTQLEQELRLQELTARLDALTGGWFSDQLVPHGTLGAVPHTRRSQPAAAPADRQRGGSDEAG
jgi:hypothetical protein